MNSIFVLGACSEGKPQGMKLGLKFCRNGAGPNNNNVAMKGHGGTLDLRPCQGRPGKRVWNLMTGFDIVDFCVMIEH